MSTTDQRNPDAEATQADRSTRDAWAVPGVDRPTRATGSAEEAETDRLGQEASDTAGLDATATAAALREAGTSTGHPVVAAVLACLDTLTGVRDVSTVTLTVREIRLLLVAVTQIIGMAFALKLRLVVAGHTQRIADLTGATSTATFLAHLTRARRPDAAAEVRLAKELDRRWPLLATALAEGLASVEQVKACVAGLRRLPKDLPADKTEACQRFLVEAAQSLDPAGLRLLGKRLWEVIDPDGAEAKQGKDLHDEEELARAKAYFRTWRNGDGTTGFRGKLPDLQADLLLKIIQAFANPRRTNNPNITTAQPDDVKDPGRPGEPIESPEERETGKTIPYPVRLGHALMELIERLPNGLLPSTGGGVAATIVATLRHDQLAAGLGTATLDTGTAASAVQVRRLACEAGIIPLVLGTASEPLDVGRESRLHTKPQRVAISVRDKTCVADGCDVPAAWCHVHHLTAWSGGGGTSVHDAVLLCGYHHRLAHHPKWRFSKGEDGRWRFIKLVT